MDARQLVAWNLRKLRVNRAISQEALATDAGVDRSYVSRVERALENPSIGVIERFAIALSVEMVDFFAQPLPGEELQPILKKGPKGPPTEITLHSPDRWRKPTRPFFTVMTSALLVKPDRFHSALELKSRRASPRIDKYQMRIDEISPLKPIKPMNAAQAMIAAKKRQVEVARMALKREREFQRRKKELEQQRKAYLRKS